MADLKVSIGSEFDNRGFKKAESSISSLTKGVKQFAGAFGAAFGVRAITRYGIAAVKAAAQDEAAQKQLALALKNVGLGRDAALSEAYIQKLQTELGVLDDELRPAYQGLAIAVGNTAEAQRLLLLSLNISKATGKGLSNVTAALSRAYLGNNTALSRLGVGISKADLESKSFLEITDQLTETFKGAAKSAADSYEGSLTKLQVAAANASETIGTGLIDALKALGRDNSVDDLAKSMESAALSVADFIRGLGQIGAFKVSGDTKTLIGLLTTPFKRSLSAGPLGAITRLGESSRTKTTSGSSLTASASAVAFEKGMGVYAVKVNKPVVENTKAIKKLTEKFDVNKAGIAAALKNPNISADTRNRLLGLQAIENGDAANSIKYGNLVKPNASMANPNATVVNIYPQGNVLTEQDLVTYIQDGLQTQSRRRGGGKLGPLII
jgi:hypothetical protein